MPGLLGKRPLLEWTPGQVVVAAAGSVSGTAVWRSRRTVGTEAAAVEEGEGRGEVEGGVGEGGSGTGTAVAGRRGGDGAAAGESTRRSSAAFTTPRRRYVRYAVRGRGGDRSRAGRSGAVAWGGVGWGGL